MKLNEKIRQLRKEKGLTLKALYERMQSAFGKNTIAFRSLRRIQAGHTDGRVSSTHQICVGLDVSLKELYEGVEEDVHNGILRKGKSLGRYIYNGSTFSDMLCSTKLDFFAVQLVLQPNGKTKIEKDPDGEQKYTKWIHVLAGKIICMVAEEKISLKTGDTFFFDSRIPHFFENNSAYKARCIIIQYPRHI